MNNSTILVDETDGSLDFYLNKFADCIIIAANLTSIENDSFEDDFWLMKPQ